MSELKLELVFDKFNTHFENKKVKNQFIEQFNRITSADVDICISECDGTLHKIKIQGNVKSYNISEDSAELAQ